ncbi:MAG: 2Fe-2S iron-sulfur cluster binding domain-containing protein [Rhodospirillales bacterium]|nr:2Fe-2S iron-sulfur cluster binding domain-containing protein [Rhodospirillales bacterium]MCB9996903.1 2Fe-2S iron-sulfur cluster binding domain-containing protein [Rhodospirillales bacterium]
MPIVTFVFPNQERREIEAPTGLSLMEIAQKSDIKEIEGVCGGCMACATCHVYVHPDWWDKCLPNGARSDEEEDMLDLAFEVGDYSRLSCQILITDELDGLVVALPGTDISAWAKAA